MLSNNALCLRTAAQLCVTIVWFNNSDWFQIYRITHSYSSHLFLWHSWCCRMERFWSVTITSVHVLYTGSDRLCRTERVWLVPLLVFMDAGTLAWIEKLKWSGLEDFLNAPRRPLYPPSGVATHNTGAFVQGYKNFVFYWILKAGHMVRE